MLNKNIIRGSKPASELVSFWSPVELENQLENDLSPQKGFEPIAGTAKKKEANSLEAEKQRLMSIFLGEANEMGIQERPKRQKTVLPDHSQTRIEEWHPSTISYIPFGMVVEQDLVEEPPQELPDEAELEEVSQEIYLHTLAEAERITQNAKSQAEQMLREAHDQVEQIRSEAYQDAYEQSRVEAENVLANARSVLEETQKWREEVLRQSEKSIISLLQTIANKLFGDGFVLEPAFVERMILRAVSEASRLGNLRVYMNPLDEEKLVSLWQESELVVNGQKIQLVSSPNINPGGCFVEGEFGSVDSRIGMQLELIQSEIQVLLFNREENLP